MTNHISTSIMIDDADTLVLVGFRRRGYSAKRSGSNIGIVSKENGRYSEGEFGSTTKRKWTQDSLSV